MSKNQGKIDAYKVQGFDLVREIARAQAQAREAQQQLGQLEAEINRLEAEAREAADVDA
jgi:chromosome segregation ATPase